jgi:hypothetical protein
MSNSKIIALAAVATLIFIVMLALSSEDSLSLTVQVVPNPLAQIVVATNSGSKPITIQNITVNERKECTSNKMLRDLSVMFGGGIFPVKLGVGDSTRIAAGCTVVRVLIESDQGSETYSFKER